MPDKPSVSTSDENRTIARTAATLFDGEASVHKYLDDKSNSAIALLASKDSPSKGITSYSTIGLSDYQFKIVRDNLPLGVEIIGACATESETFANIISSIAFTVINDSQECMPDTVFRNVVSMNDPSSTLEHALLVDPFLWPTKFDTLYFDNKAVAWLQAVPISNSELEHLENHGVQVLHTLFSENQIDVFDIRRQSVV